MAMKRFSAATPAKLMTKYPGNNALAKIGHINEVIDEINNTSNGKVVFNYPFNWYPEPALVDNGIKYEYQPWTPGEDPINMKSYSVKAYMNTYNNSGIQGQYLYSLRITDINTMGAIILPESITGSIQSYEDGETWSMLHTPLANGSKVGVTEGGDDIFIKNPRVSLYNYSGNNEDYSTWFAILFFCDFVTADGIAATPTSDVTIALDYRILTSAHYNVTLIND